MEAPLTDLGPVRPLRDLFSRQFHPTTHESLQSELHNQTVHHGLARYSGCALCSVRRAALFLDKRRNANSGSLHHSILKERIFFFLFYLPGYSDDRQKPNIYKDVGSMGLMPRITERESLCGRLSLSTSMMKKDIFGDQLHRKVPLARLPEGLDQGFLPSLMNPTDLP